MELKPAHKLSKAGGIPEDWEAPELGVLFTFKNGLNKGKRFFGYGKPIVNYMDVYGSTGLYACNIHGRVDVSKRELDAFSVRRGDVFFTRTSETPEEIGIASVLLDDSPETVFSGFVLRARPTDGRLVDSFKRYCFSSDVVRSQIVSQSTYTTRALTSGRALSAVALPLPTRIDEQEAIAEVLNDADALVESVSQLLAKKRQLKHGAMQELLTGRSRLPGFRGEWAMRRLGDVAEMGSGGTPSSSVAAFYDGDIPWVSISDITKCGKFIFSTDRNLSTAGLNNSAAQLFPAGTVLYAMYASIGECSIAGAPLASSQAILGIRVKSGLDHQFLYYFLASIKEEVKKIGQQGTQANLNKGMIQSFQLRLPPHPEQSAIAAVLSDMDAEIAALEEKLAKARQIKQGMMQELLTGRIRLVRPEPAAAEPAALAGA
jgi:type I restriction enzyme S subunit